MSRPSIGNLWVAVIATAALTAGAMELFHLYKEKLQSDTKAVQSKDNKSQPREYSEELIREQLARNYTFLSEEGMEKVRNQHIVVVGAGGVGSWVATMLVRSGVGKIRIIDFDQVSLSSLNRHAVANLKDVGISKVECLRNHLMEIAPWVDISVENRLWNLESGEELIFGNDFQPTYVVDCIDNLDTKTDLLEFCYRRDVPVISSGGAACKSDPTRVNVGDISKTDEDPLAKSVRVKLKKRGITTGIPVVFSTEKPDPRKAKLLPLAQAEFEKGKVDQLSALLNFRVRILPVLGTVPGMFGLTIATHLITTIAGYPVEPIEGKNRLSAYNDVLQSLAGQQARIGKKDHRVPIALADIPYIMEEVFHCKSPISNYSTRLAMSRWDPDHELSFQNVVIMTKEEQQAHEKRVLLGKEPLAQVYSQEIIDRVNARFAEERYYSQFH